jgi:hypothetical protein
MINRSPDLREFISEHSTGQLQIDLLKRDHGAGRNSNCVIAMKIAERGQEQIDLPEDYRVPGRAIAVIDERADRPFPARLVQASSDSGNRMRS